MIKNLILTIVSTLLTLLVAEGILRTFYADYLYTGSTARSLYYTSPNFTLTDDNRSVHYAPNTDIRSIAVYFNRVEYDTKHHANNFGFLSDENYTKENKPGVIFLGDSFTAGVGSTSPWIPKLNKKYPDINLYSFGVSGTGTGNFYNLFETYKNSLNFDTVVIVIISDDLLRKLWHPVEKNGYLYFDYYTHHHFMQRVAKIIDYNIDSSTLLKPEELYLYKAFKVLKKKILQKNASAKTAKKRTIPMIRFSNYDLSYIKKINQQAKQMHKKVLLVHIPQKDEVKAGFYKCDIEQKIKKLGIAYYPLLFTKKFDLSMYHKHDGHPNDKGYDYIGSTIEEILKLKK